MCKVIRRWVENSGTVTLSRQQKFTILQREIRTMVIRGKCRWWMGALAALLSPPALHGRDLYTDGHADIGVGYEDECAGTALPR